MHHRRAFIEPVVVEKSFGIVRNDVGANTATNTSSSTKANAAAGHMLFLNLRQNSRQACGWQKNSRRRTPMQQPLVRRRAA